MNVISLTTAATGTLYTCPASTVAQVEILAGINVDITMGTLTLPWVGATQSQFRSSISDANGAAAADDVISEQEGTSYVLRPRKIKLGPGHYISASSSHIKSFIIYEESTGAH